MEFNCNHLLISQNPNLKSITILATDEFSGSITIRGNKELETFELNAANIKPDKRGITKMTIEKNVKLKTFTVPYDKLTAISLTVHGNPLLEEAAVQSLRDLNGRMAQGNKLDVQEFGGLLLLFILTLLHV